MNKRIAAVVLSLLLLLSACGESVENTDSPSAAETELAPEIVEEAETEPVISDDLPESDFEGYEYVIYNSNPETNTWFITVHVVADEDSAEAIPAAIFKRNLAVEERMNIRISEVEQSADQIKNAIMSGDSSFDLTLMQGPSVLAQAQSGYLIDLKTLPHQNFEKPYWDYNAYKQLSICNKLFICVGDFLTTDRKSVV